MARMQTNTINQTEPQSDSILSNNGTSQGAKHDKERIAAAYPASPLLGTEPEYNPVEAFENLVLAGDLTQPTALAAGAALATASTGIPVCSEAACFSSSDGGGPLTLAPVFPILFTIR